MPSLSSSLLLVLPLLAAAQGPASSPSTRAPLPPWTYIAVNGPNHWGDVQQYATCGTGQAQSPIDLNPKLLTKQNCPTFTWADVENVAVVITPKGIVAKFSPGQTCTVQGNEHDLLYMTIHTPSEHRVLNVHADLELQLHHVCPITKNQVIASVLYQVSDKKHESSFFKCFGSEMPTAGSPALLPTVNLTGLLSDVSEFSNYWSYDGSLTTPPCSETATWVIASKVLTISWQQFNVIRWANKFNARMVQPNADSPVYDAHGNVTTTSAGSPGSPGGPGGPN